MGYAEPQARRVRRGTLCLQYNDRARGPDGAVVYESRAVNFARLRWGRIVDEEVYEDTQKVADFDGHLRAHAPWAEHAEPAPAWCSSRSPPTRSSWPCTSWPSSSPTGFPSPTRSLCPTSAATTPRRCRACTTSSIASTSGSPDRGPFLVLLFGLVIILLTGGLGGAVVVPASRRMVELFRADVEATPGGREITWGAAYDRLYRRYMTAEIVLGLSVLTAIFFMAAKPFA